MTNQGPSTKTGCSPAQMLNETIRKRIVTARLLSRLDQKDAAKRLGYFNSSGLSKIESGMAKIPKDFIIRAAVAYGVSSDYLLGLSSEPERDPRMADHMAIMRGLDATISQQNHALASILLKNASDMIPMEGHLFTLLAPVRRCIEAFERDCRKNKQFQDDVLGGAALQRAIDEIQVAFTQAKKFMEHRADLAVARTEALADSQSYPLFE
ncbi:helix-turn-helix domain-containing protein [Glaciimonas sp. GNP009]